MGGRLDLRFSQADIVQVIVIEMDDGPHTTVTLHTIGGTQMWCSCSSKGPFVSTNRLRP